MDLSALKDKSVKPNEDILFLIIGDKIILWQEIIKYLNDKQIGVSEEWKFANDTKNWFLRTLFKKKTIFWIKILNNTFRIAFWFGDKAEMTIEQSDLPDNLKNDFKTAKKMGNMGRCIAIDMSDFKDLETVFKLIEIKLKII